MVAAIQTPQPTSQAQRLRPVRYTGEVVYIYAFDVAYELTREPITELLGQKLVPFRLDIDRRHPKQHFFYQPQMIRLPPIERVTARGPVTLERVVKLLPVGAISITVRVPVAVDSLEDLVVYHDLHFDSGSLNFDVRLLAEVVRRELEPYCVRPVPALTDDEAYTAFCLHGPLLDNDGEEVNTESWLTANRRQVAALLTQESDINLLSRQEAEESTSRHVSYYKNDLAVVDWDAALIVDDKSAFEETLYILELANLQLAELEAYDRILDDSFERAYRDLSRRNLRARVHVLRELREIRIDMARVSDELMNSTKFFGDWHLARLYENIAARFHLADWHHAVEEKLKTLDGLYEILKHDQNNRWMLMLEVTIVLLFIIDLLVLCLGLQRP